MLLSNFTAKYIFNNDVNVLDFCAENYPLIFSYKNKFLKQCVPLF